MPGFISETIKVKQPIVNSDFTHAVCIGQTGCGKTSSFILPNVKKRLKDGHGLFIIDYKGSLNQQIKALALEENRIEDVIEVGVAWGKNINMIANTSKKLFLDTIENLDDENSGEGFWKSSALAIIGVVYDIIMYMDYLQSLNLNCTSFRMCQSKYKLNIKTFSNIMKNKDSIEDFLNEIRKNVVILSKMSSSNEKSEKNRDFLLIMKFISKIEYLQEKLWIFAEGIDEDRPNGGHGGVLFMIKSFLNSFDQNGLDGDIDILDLLESKKIVIIRADSFTKHATEGLMNILYTRLALRDNKTPITLIIDEFQRTVTKKSLPFVDVFREKKVELIAAFQNMSQLNTKVGEEETEEFILNIVSRFDYAQKGENEFGTFEYENDSKKNIANPIFFDDEDLMDTQYIWQIKTGIKIEQEGKWIYKKSYDIEKSLIYNIETQQNKIYYSLSAEDKKLLRQFNEIKIA